MGISPASSARRARLVVALGALLWIGAVVAAVIEVGAHGPPQFVPFPATACPAPLIGVDSTDSLVETLRGQRVAAVVVGLGFAVLLVVALADAVRGFSTKGLTAAQAEKGNVVAIAERLFSNYVLAFEATSALLITAGVGAMVLAHRERIEPRRTQKELMLERVRRGGAGLAPLPGPGVYADHDAVDTPALLPDGSAATGSVPEHLQVSAARPHTDEIAGELE